MRNGHGEKCLIYVPVQIQCFEAKIQSNNKSITTNHSHYGWFTWEYKPGSSNPFFKYKI